MRFTYLILLVTFSVVDMFGSEPVSVQTQYGNILGYQTNWARVFYGIPFAQPPIGALRWQPPVPIARWYPKVINATQPPAACAQTPNILYGVHLKGQMSEDCLYLNIFTPLMTSTASSNTSLPVMIFIHGGGFQAGSASDSIYEAEHLVNTTNVIVALIQYRLGVFGFFATGSGPKDIRGNYGILDQRLAIAWIKANIDAFGGNPNEITLFGQSAGAQSTALHYLTSEMQPYFQRAIIQSSPMTVPFRTYMQYVTAGVLLAEQLHCASNDIPCFRNRSTSEIIAAQAAVNTMLTSLNALFFFEPWLPVIDNVIVNGSLLDTVFKTSFQLKELIIGTLTDECYDFVYSMWGKPITTQDYLALAILLFKEKGLKVIERYPPNSSGDQRLVIVHACTQWVFACPTRTFARKAASYSYVFGYPYDTESRRNSLGCSNRACHGDELPFEFEAFWTNLTDAGRRVSQSMATYWTNFAKSQDPNEPLNVSVSWPRVTTGDEKYMYIQDPLSVGQNYLKDDCDFWDQIGYKSFF